MNGLFENEILVGAKLNPHQEFSKRERRALRRLALRRAWSANLLVDLGGTCQLFTSLAPQGAGSGLAVANSSGPIIGNTVNLNNADTACNLWATGISLSASGVVTLQVQCADADTSGLYTDPTSGLAQFPGAFQSGGLLVLGASGGLLNVGVSGQFMLSGFMAASLFQRPQTFARVNLLSGGFFFGSLTAGFATQNRTTGSGGGFSWQPSSGTVINV